MRPAHRRRGYATDILRQSLIVARAVGVNRALVSCDDSNTASAADDRALRWVLDNVVDDDGALKRRYWIA